METWTLTHKEEPVAIKFEIMKKIKSIWLTIFVIICFLFIQISYNNTPSHSIFSAFIAICYQSIDKGLDLSITNFTMNFTYTLIEFLFVSIWLLIASKVENKKMISIGLFLFVILWGFWMYSYRPYIEIDVFIISSIPFLISLGLIITHLIRKP